MNINHVLVLSVCVTVSSITYSMNQENNNDDLYTIDIPIENQNATNHENNHLIVNNQQPINPNPLSKKSTMLSLVNQLKVSLSEQRSKINNNAIKSSIFFAGGVFSYAVGCSYNTPALTVLGLIQLTGSVIVGGYNNQDQAGEFHCKNDLICNNLVQNINALPDIENQLGNNN